MSAEKPLPPSRRRLQQARRDGQVLKSSMLTDACRILGALILVQMGLRFCWVRYCLLVKWILTEELSEPFACVREIVRGGLMISLSVLVGGAVAAWCGGLAQVGVSWELSPLAPRLVRLHPLAGLRRIAAGARDARWSVVRLGLVLVVLHGFFSDVVRLLSRADWADVVSLETAAGVLGGRLALWCAAFAVLFGASDYFVQRRRFMRELAMSFEEARREMREDEGDPHVRAVRRSLHETYSRREQIRRLKQARVVVVESHQERDQRE